MLENSDSVRVCVCVQVTFTPVKVIGRPQVCYWELSAKQGRQVGCSDLLSLSPTLGLQACVTTLAFFFFFNMGLGLHDCAASTLSTKPSAQLPCCPLTHVSEPGDETPMTSE